MKVYLTRRYGFSASHRLNSHALSPEENHQTYGKCNNPFGHGHNYFIEITVSGPVDSQTGMVCNLADLDGWVRENILEHFDHQDLNHLTEFEKKVPTTENLCVAIFELLHRGFHQAHLTKVRIEETMMNSFEYSGESQP